MLGVCYVLPLRAFDCRCLAMFDDMFALDKEIHKTTIIMNLKTVLMALLAVPFVASLSSCSDDEPEAAFSISPKKVALRSTETQQMSVSDKRNVTWSVENDYNAKINADGELVALRIGKTNVVATDDNGQKAKAEVEVIAKYNTFVEPYTKWGASKSQVKSYEKRSLGKETDTGISFEDSGVVPLVLYLFSETGALESASVLAKASYVDEIVGFLHERYNYLGKDGDYFCYVDETEKMGVFVSVYNISYYMIAYLPLSDSDNKSISLDSVAPTIEALRNLIEK